MVYMVAGAQTQTAQDVAPRAAINRNGPRNREQKEGRTSVVTYGAFQIHGQRRQRESKKLRYGTGSRGAYAHRGVGRSGELFTQEWRRTAE